MRGLGPHQSHLYDCKKSSWMRGPQQTVFCIVWFLYCIGSSKIIIAFNTIVIALCWTACVHPKKKRLVDNVEFGGREFGKAFLQNSKVLPHTLVRSFFLDCINAARFSWVVLMQAKVILLLIPSLSSQFVGLRVYKIGAKCIFKLLSVAQYPCPLVFVEYN